MKNLFFVLVLGASLSFTACGDDDEDVTIPPSSASLTFDGVTYAKAGDTEVTYFDFSIDDDDDISYSISGDVANGSDTLSFTIIIPSLTTGEYTKAATNDEDANISVRLADGTAFDTNPFFTNVTDLSDYTLTITAVSEQTISGEFTATLFDDFNNATIEASGEFVAVDAALFLGDLLDLLQ